MRSKSISKKNKQKKLENLVELYNLFSALLLAQMSKRDCSTKEI